MPRLTDFLRGYGPFEQALEESAGRNVELAAPTFLHPYLTAGFLSRAPWSDAMTLVVAATQEQAEEMERELRLFLPARPVFYLPPRGVWYGSEGEVKPRVAGRRARALAALLGAGGSSKHFADPARVAGNAPAAGAKPVLVLEATTLLEDVVPPTSRPLAINVGDSFHFEDLVRALAALGYVRVDQVEEAGEFSVRGGLIDIFPATERSPVRVEFWGDEVESLRSFSVYSQRSLGPLDCVIAFAAANIRSHWTGAVDSCETRTMRAVGADHEIEQAVLGLGKLVQKCVPAPRLAG